MRSKLNEKAMASELSDSAFFAQPRMEPTEPGAEPDSTAAMAPKKPPTSQSTQPGVTTPQRHGVTTAPKEADTDQIENLRRAVKQPGKDHSTYRLTVEEKQELARIVYSYGERGIKTTFNEITRVGLNWLLEDFRARSDDSILARVLARLND
jgi:hypothetical protein